MYDTWSEVDRAGDPVFDQGHVTAYGQALPVPEMDVMSAGSGGVITTADDIAKWLAMQTANGRTRDG